MTCTLTLMTLFYLVLGPSDLRGQGPLDFQKAARQVEWDSFLSERICIGRRKYVMDLPNLAIYKMKK